jgi:NAD(P)-dependent dehydrogenase (short-subunit alcohol dehydrogenase family)
VDYGSSGRHPTLATPPQEWQQVIGTNCIGHCILVSRLLTKLTANSPGVIVNISSDIAVLPGPGRAAYAASKAGLHAMLRAVAAENPIESLRVYQLIPTFQLMTAGLRRRRPTGFDFSSYADPDVIARIVPQLLSPDGGSIAPGTYLVRRDGTLGEYPETTQA